MNAATLEKSKRLQRVLTVLQSGPKTTMEIIQLAQVCAVNSIVAELRANGKHIECTTLKRGVFMYRLVEQVSA